MRYEVQIEIADDKKVVVAVDADNPRLAKDQAVNKFKGVYPDKGTQITEVKPIRAEEYWNR